MKKFLAMLVCLCMLLSVGAMAETARNPITTAEGLTAALGFPLVDEPMSVTIALMKNDVSPNLDTEKNWLCQFMERYSGLDITWQLIDHSTRDEKIQLMMNSGDMPDAILGYFWTPDQIVRYGVTEEMLYPIDELLEYTPNFAKYLDEIPTLRKEITATDGHIYGYPETCNLYSYDQRYWINTAWLERVGKEIPTTLAEFKDVLVAFRDMDANGDGDPSNETPYGASWSYGWSSNRDFFLAAYGVMGNSKSIGVDYRNGEKVVYIPNADCYKDYITYLNDLYTEGLLDPDAFTQTELESQKDVMDGQVGFTYMSSPDNYDPSRMNEWLHMAPIVDEEGAQQMYPGPAAVQQTARMVINADCDKEKAIVLATLADKMFTKEWLVIGREGPEAGSELDWDGTGHYYNEETGFITYNVAEDMNSEWEHRNNYLTFWSMPGFIGANYDPMILEYAAAYPDTEIGKANANGVAFEWWQPQFIEVSQPYYVSRVPKMFFSAEDSERINELIVALDAYTDGMEAKFISGELSIEENWDEFQATMDEYGVEELEALYNTYFDAWKAA